MLDQIKERHGECVPLKENRGDFILLLCFSFWVEPCAPAIELCLLCFYRSMCG